MTNSTAPKTADRARIPLLDTAEMSAEQRALHDDVVSGPRGRMIGPLRAAIHSPEMATLWSDFGEFIRYRTCLPKHLNELAIIVTARRWHSEVEWWVHHQVGLAEGLPRDLVDAILKGDAPNIEDKATAEIYEFARELQLHGKVSADLHAAVTDRWGVRGVVELTAVIGYYTMVAMMLNAHELPLPDQATAHFADEATLFSLPAAKGGSR